VSKRGNAEGSIYQRTSDGKWVGAVHLGWEGGKRQRKTVYGDTRTEVAERMKKLLSDHQQHIPIQTPERLTTAAFLARWLEDTAKPSVRPGTFDSYASYIEHHISPAVGHVKLTKLSPQDVQRMMARIMKAGRSARTAGHARAILRNALGEAVKWGLLARNVAALADPPRTTTIERVTFTPDQARAFFEGIQWDREGALYLLTLACGLRMGEVTGLCWDDMDLEAGTLRVRQTLQRGSGAWRVGEPKSSTSRRQLAIPPVAVEGLRLHRLQQQREREKAGPLWADTMGLVFTTEMGEPVNPSSLTRRFRGKLTTLKLPQMRFHDLRHSCASLLIAQGVHPRLIMETLGHSQIGITMNLYGHVAPIVQREVASQMNDLLSGVR